MEFTESLGLMEVCEYLEDVEMEGWLENAGNSFLEEERCLETLVLITGLKEMMSLTSIQTLSLASR